MENTRNKKGLFKTLAERSKAETPSFFKKLRLVGLTLAAVGGVLVAAPIALPAALVTAGGYLIVVGSVATAVSQVTVKDDDCEPKKKD
ncbi:MAG: hypothetical protein V4580_02100 [Bacteroidota bacterium]